MLSKRVLNYKQMAYNMEIICNIELYVPELNLGIIIN